jgi:ribonuclease HII
MRRAVEQIQHADYALVDAWTIPELTIPQQGIIKGDATVKSIAAASIIAKVTRDRMLYEFEEQYPQYGFATHKGYGTKQHRDAIANHGPCPIHRLGYKTFN